MNLKDSMETFSHVNSKGIPFDHKLDQEVFLGKENGVFIELGAFNGITQSNTAFLEKYRNWTGVLVEPSKNQYNLCVKNRPNSKCFNELCSDVSGKDVYFDHREHLMSKVSNSGHYKTKTRTLESILDESNIGEQIDFLSLDVEGYEMNILNGLNIKKYRPSYMLIEIWDLNKEEVIDFLKQNGYNLECNFSNYNTKDNPCWSKDRNDFLFHLIHM